MPWVTLHCQLAIYMTDVLEVAYPAWGGTSKADVDIDALERDTIQLVAAERQLDKWYAQARRAEVSDPIAECVLLNQSLAYIFYL